MVVSVFVYTYVLVGFVCDVLCDVMRCSLSVCVRLCVFALLCLYALCV